VSDAGTPVLSDPGRLLVAAAHEAGIRVEPVPGPSAAIAALSASGVVSEGFVFAGFPPSRSLARKRWLEQFKGVERAVVLYEAPHRIRGLLQDLIDVLGDPEVTLGRELTKIHEELVTRPTSGHLEVLMQPKGEFTLVVHPRLRRPTDAPPAPHPSTLLVEFGELTNSRGASRREALQTLAAKYGLPRREVYRLLEEGKP
jgi:16S rRNA (cytidine1402-2'-O)-methyltransferase